MSCGGSSDGAHGASPDQGPPGSTSIEDDGGAVARVGAAAGDAATAGDGAAAEEAAAPEPQVPWLTNPASHVNTLVGTTEGGNMFPGADYPFGMVQWSPDTTPDRPSGGGYEYKDSSILGFSLTHISGPGCSGAFGDVPILPLTGGLPGGDLNAAKQSFSHTGEVATAGYYSVKIGSPSITTELTATLHSAMARFTYPATNNANLLFKLHDSAAGNFGSATATIVSNQEVTGSTSSGNFCGTGKPYVIHFDMMFDQPFTASKIIAQSGQTSPGFVFLTFDASKTQVVQAKVGISFISTNNAHDNWTAENPASQWNFDTVKSAAENAWNTTLGQIQITGGTTSEQELFYTSLYHSLLHPNVSTDTNGQYMGFDGAVHTVSGTQKEQYVNYSGWDIYHTQVQLSAIVAPQAMSDSAQSMLNDASQNGGMLPKWSLESGENDIMVGDPADGIIAGYYAFGAQQFDTATALKVMLKEATVPNQMRPGLSDYESLGYVPDDVGYDQAAGFSLEYCQADFALSEFAAAMGDTTDAAAMLKRAQNWQYLFDPSVDMFIPKLKNGTFVAGVGPSSSHGLTEGDASQYRWVIAYDRQAQLAAQGGPSVVNPALDAFFSKLDDFQGPSAFLTNEFELGTPYWDNYTGEPWKTQEIVNRIRTTLYHDAPGFLDNNDDLGAMSSALVWSMLGMYPDYPGSAILTLNGPEFTNERIHLPSGKYLTVTAVGASDTNFYIQSLQVNGQRSDKTWLDPSVVVAGATLDFTMGATASPSWGSAAADVAPSYGVDSTSGFVFATPNPLTLGAGASAEVNLNAQSARSDVSQNLSWSVSPQNFSLDATSGSLSLGPGARATSKIKVTAPGGFGNYSLTFQLTSSVGGNAPAYMLPIVIN
jgi:predicted alpha-1,2-mannosidase